MAKILVVEDEPMVLFGIENQLKINKHSVLVANNGLDGLKTAIKEVPDLIVSDINMPKLDGLEMYEALKQNPFTARIPVIFLTALSDKDDIRRGMEMGAEDYITKPFTFPDLYKAVLVRLEKQKELEKTYEEQLDQIKLHLARAIPHEMRNSLNGILSTSHFLVEYFDELKKADLKELHSAIFQSAKKLNNLIAKYLFFINLELQENKEIIKENCTIPADIIKIKAGYMGDEYSRKDRIEFNLENADIVLSEQYLSILCEELVDNCMKFSDSNTTVKIASEVKNNNYIIHFTDNGRGFDETQITQIRLFTQFDRQIFEQQGIGLGLSIVKKVLEYCNGTISIESIPNEVTTVSISIPISEPS